MSNQAQRKPLQQNPDQVSQATKPEATKSWDKDASRSQGSMKDQSSQPSRDQFHSDASKK